MVTAANGDDRWLVLAGQQVAGNKGVENIGQTFVLMGGQMEDVALRRLRIVDFEPEDSIAAIRFNHHVDGKYHPPRTI